MDCITAGQYYRAVRFIGLMLLLVASAAADQILLPPVEWDALRNEISGDRSWTWTNAISQFDRNIGSDGYVEAMRYVEEELRKVGVGDIRVVELPFHEPSWTGLGGELWMREPVERKIGSWADSGTAIALYSRSGGATAQLVDVGEGLSEADYEGRNVEGKIVLACGRLENVFQLAVFRYGAAGVVSCAPRWPGPAFEFPDNMGWQRIPIEGTAGRDPTWAFSVSLHTAEELRELLRAGHEVVLSASVRTKFVTPGTMHLLIATIPGSDIQGEAIVYTSHLDHMRGGATDAASGCANMIEIARAILTLADTGKIRPPRREIQFWFAPEVHGEYAYFARFPEERDRILININQELIGENQPKLGASAVVERAPWSIPTYLNDVAEHFVRHMLDTNTGMINQYERFSDPLFAAGGSRDAFRAFMTPFFPTSDHEPFSHGLIGIPATHFTAFPNYFIHSNQDTIYNIDATQLRRYALLAGAVGYFVATADESVVPGLVNEVSSGSAILVARMARLAGRLLEEDSTPGYSPNRAPPGVLEGRFERATLAQRFHTGREALEIAARYAADNVRSVSHFAGTEGDSRRFVEESATRVEALGRVAVAHLESAFAAHTGGGAVPPRELAEVERAAQGMTPRYKGTLAEIFARRRAVRNSDPPLGTALRFELEGLIDGQRNALEIWRVLHAESLNGGSPLYGPVTVDQVVQRLENLAAAGVIEIER